MATSFPKGWLLCAQRNFCLWMLVDALHSALHCQALLECEGRTVSPNASTCEAHFLTGHASCPLPETYVLVAIFQL